MPPTSSRANSTSARSPSARRRSCASGSPTATSSWRMRFRRAAADAAALDLDRAYAGGFPDLKFECNAVERNHITWRPEINPHPAKALDIHHFSPAIRNLMFADAIAEFLGLIFESKAFASQTLGFLRGSAQEGHQDSAYVAYSIPRQFAATWTALEDVTDRRGRAVLLSGQPPLRGVHLPGHYKSVSRGAAHDRRADRAPAGGTPRPLAGNAGGHSVASQRCRSPRRRATCWFGTPTWCTAAIRSPA